MTFEGSNIIRQLGWVAAVEWHGQPRREGWRIKVCFVCSFILQKSRQNVRELELFLHSSWNQKPAAHSHSNVAAHSHHIQTKELWERGW